MYAILELFLLFSVLILVESDIGEKSKLHFLMKSLFIAYGSLFSFMRPIEALTYKRIAPLLVIQLVRFVFNVLSILLMIGLIWLPGYGIVNRQRELTYLAIGTIAAGL